MKLIQDQHPGLAFGAVFHTSDALEIDAKAEIVNWLGGSNFVPCGAVDCQEQNGSILFDRGDWSDLTNSALSTSAICAVDTITSLTEKTLTVRVVAGFSSSPLVAVGLTVYVTGDGITGCPQSNYYDMDPASVFFSAENPIVDYVHDHVVRAVLSSAMEDTLSVGNIVTNTPYVLDYTYQIPADQVAANLSVIQAVP